MNAFIHLFTENKIVTEETKADIYIYIYMYIYIGSVYLHSIVEDHSEVYMGIDQFGEVMGKV